MRDHPLRRLIIALCACCVLGASLALAEGAGLLVLLDSPDTLQLGDRTSVAVTVDLPANVRSDTPLLLTPSVDGAALEVVRGRLFRADATVLGPTRLGFQVPVVAQREGAAILRVEVSTYACSGRCRAISASAHKTLRVQAR